jgi:exonuclease VII small subunit
MPKKTTDALFKQVLPELEQIVQQLDCGADDLENPLHAVETGDPLTHPCEKTLSTLDKRQPPESFTDE